MRRGLGLGLGVGYRLSPGGAADITEPVIVSAHVSADGFSVILTYNEALDAGSTPATGAYTLAGTASVVSSVVVTGSTVVLTVNTAIFASDLPLVSYAVPGSNKARDLAGNNAAALAVYATWNGSAVSSGAPFFIQGTLTDVAKGANLGFALDDTNTISYAQTVCSDPNDPNIVYVFWYAGVSGQICCAKSTTGPAGDFTTTVGTATLVSITDEHRTISAWVDSTGRANCAFGMHGHPMNWWRATNPGDTLITDATKLSVPVVAGNSAAEAFVTYPQRGTFTNGDVAFIWRSGGSGNGVHYLYLVSGTTVTGVGMPFLGNYPTVDNSFYPNTLCIEGANSKVPDRVWASVQVRETTDPTTAHDEYCFYIDKANLLTGGWKAFDGTALTAPLTVASMSAAKVASIPQPSTLFYGFQGMAVGLDGVPTIVSYLTLPSSGFGIYAWRYQGGSGTAAWPERYLFGAAGDATQYSRVKCIWKDRRLVVLWGYGTTSGSAGEGQLSYVTAEGEALCSPVQGTVFIRNGINKFGISSANWDEVHWQANMGVSGAGPNIYFQNTRQDINPGVNGPALLQTAFVSITPTIQDPLEVFGASNLDWRVRGDSVTLDGSGNVQTLLDTTGHSRDLTQGTSTKRAGQLVAAINGRNAWHYDGVDDFHDLNFSRAAATPFFVFLIVRPTLWSFGARIFDFNGACVLDSSASPSLRMNQGSSQNPINLTINAWHSLVVYYSGSTADYIRVDDTYTTLPGTSAGTTFGAANVTLGASAGGGSLWKQCDVAEALAIRATPTAKQIYDLIGYRKAYYGF